MRPNRVIKRRVAAFTWLLYCNVVMKVAILSRKAGFLHFFGECVRFGSRFTVAKWYRCRCGLLIMAEAGKFCKKEGSAVAIKEWEVLVRVGHTCLTASPSPVSPSYRPQSPYFWKRVKS